jgi:hypothetical protein
VFDGEQVSAHVDLVSPLNFDRERPAQYSPLRVVAHNLTGMAGDLSRLVRRGGRRGRSVESALGVWAG